jgi:hypothetical protein
MLPAITDEDRERFERREMDTIPAPPEVLDAVEDVPRTKPSAQ